MEKSVGQKQATSLQKNTVPKPNWNAENKASLSQVLGRICALQHQYGQIPADIETLVDGFAWALADYSLPVVIDAMGVYIRTHRDIPTPSDIINILSPPIAEWQPDWEVYKTYKKLRADGGPYALSQDEIDYINACENHSMDKLKKSKESVTQQPLEIPRQNKP